MEKEIVNKEKEIFSKIKELENGTNSDKTLAFDIIGILGNESTCESYENRLEIVEEMINDHLESKKSIK